MPNTREKLIELLEGAKNSREIFCTARLYCSELTADHLIANGVTVQQWIPGQEIYVVERDEDGAACDVSGYMFLAEVAGAAILTSYINDLETLEETLDYHIEETADNYDTDLVVFPVDDCYADRDAAEQALHG